MKQQKVSTRISKCWVEWNTTGLYFFCVGFALCFSSELKCTMKFGVYLPPAAEGSKVPVLYWLSGEWHSVSICVWTCVCKHMGLSMCLWANVSEHVFVSKSVRTCVCEQMCLDMFVLITTNWGGDVTQLVEHQTGLLLMQVQCPGAARDFSPRVNLSADSYSVCTPPCAIACVYVCAHIKDRCELWKH